jgi:hypothetical protein
VAWAGDAFAFIDGEQGVVCGALYQCIVQIQEFILLPLETGTGMRTLIVIGKKVTVFMYHEDVTGFTFYFNLETFTAGVFDIGGFAENVYHDVW